MFESVKHFAKVHVKKLRELFANIPFRSIYDFDVYLDVFADDIVRFYELCGGRAKVLDFGCGRGTSAYVLSNIGFDVVGVDIYEKEFTQLQTSGVFPYKMQKKAWRMVSSRNGNCSFSFYDGQNLPFDDSSFDAVFAYAVLEHVSDLPKILDEIRRVLKKDGMLFISRTPKKYSYSEFLARVLKIPAHDRLFTRGEISRCLKGNGFRIKSIESIDFFPAQVGISFLQKPYQRMSGMLLFLDKIVRKTPLNLFSHHFRIVATKA